MDGKCSVRSSANSAWKEVGLSVTDWVDQMMRYIPGACNHAQGEVCPVANLQGCLKPLPSSGNSVLTHIDENRPDSAAISACEQCFLVRRKTYDTTWTLLAILQSNTGYDTYASRNKKRFGRACQRSYK